MALDYKAAVVVLAIVFISTVSAARVVPLSIIQKPIGAVNIFDNSKYRLLQLSNGLAQTPPMGWNSWNFFACDINETLIKETDGPQVLEEPEVCKKAQQAKRRICF